MSWIQVNRFSLSDPKRIPIGVDGGFRVACIHRGRAWQEASPSSSRQAPRSKAASRSTSSLPPSWLPVAGYASSHTAVTPLGQANHRHITGTPLASEHLRSSTRTPLAEAQPLTHPRNTNGTGTPLA